MMAGESMLSKHPVLGITMALFFLLMRKEFCSCVQAVDKQTGKVQFLSVGSITEVLASAGSASIHGTSTNSNARRFSDLMKLRETVL